MTTSTPTARLIGNRKTPAFELSFSREDRTPDGDRLQEWVKALPQRRWSPERGAWVVTSFGRDPDAVLARAGVTADLSRGASLGITTLSQLCSLKVELDPDDPTTTLIYPRLYPVEEVKKFLPASASYSWQAMRFEAATTSMLTAGLKVPASVKKAAKELLDARVDNSPVARAAQAAAGAASMDEVSADVAKVLISHAGEIPEWFALDLYPYQRVGAFSIAAGHRGLVDEPGLGKTRQGLAFLAIQDAQRAVIVVPPVVLTNWRREVTQSGLATLPPPPVRKTKKATASPTEGAGTSLAPPTDQAAGPLGGQIVSQPTRPGKYHVVLIQSGRKVPDLPERGVVIVADSLIASRPGLVDQILDWQPDAMLLDEAHRTMTWTSTRSKAVRRLSSRVNGPTVTISGTPLFASPSELATQLALTGHLDSVFGGLDKFLNTYCRYSARYDKWSARKLKLPELYDLLMQHVWVRRTKAQVLPDLPKKSRNAKFLDVDLREFRRAHADVKAIVEAWTMEFLKAKSRVPTPEEAKEWLGDQLHLVTMLRRAAGLSKVDAAADIIREHVAATTEEGPDGQPVYTRPLIVWTHHQDVSAAMAAAVPASAGTTAVIVGETGPDERGRIVDDFQAGKISVLVASITAAGVGITLTAGCDAIFVETDWSPQLVIQAEDRQCRIGQTRPVTITTLIAEGTLDPQVQATQRRKIAVLEEVLVGGDLDVAVIRVVEDSDQMDGPSEAVRVLLTMFDEVVAAMKPTSRSVRAAA